MQMTTDCGSETTLIYALASALREAFFPDLSLDEIPAHRFLRSIHNITIERGWSQLKFQFDKNVEEFWQKGICEGIYDPYDDQHIGLAKWLWARIIQKEINLWKDQFNAHRTRKDPAKYNPSGVSLNVVFALYEQYGGMDCLQKFTQDMLGQISELKEHIGGEELLQFVTPGFANICEVRLKSLKIPEMDFTLVNAWDIFNDLFPLVFEKQL
ncbi:hypothetical protein M422DRAFT_269523 [Sphaerobolus stellatus SS14]|uniref:Integrase core domain-containing protein n=1 Tax=Sphaerobolus stellatus (strain SS14) TaxID=990650 RepID=A0A0C9UJM5_SPHS4|nr:hypothetical protein M422DRAFT_269523 [Sphaerobolus stellatus SS14]